MNAGGQETSQGWRETANEACASQSRVPTATAPMVAVITIDGNKDLTFIGTSFLSRLVIWPLRSQRTFYRARSSFRMR